MNVSAAINAGLFVQFVYNNWNIPNPNLTNSLDGKLVVTSAGTPVIPDQNYNVIKTIYANDLATDISPNKTAQGFRTIGIVAQNTSDASDVFVAIRGTEGIWEWVQDAKFLLRTFPPVTGSGLTEDGFTDMYLSFSLAQGGGGAFMNDVKNALPSQANVTVAGHSLGSSLATLCALDMAVNTGFSVGLYTLASPRVGDLAFHNLFNHVVKNAYRVANRMDLVTHVPVPPLYWHVGDDTELTPPDTMKYDIPCEHHLSTYFNMLAALIGQQNQYPIDNDCLKQPVASAVAAHVEV
jgi:Lipase (class 3)